MGRKAKKKNSYAFYFAVILGVAALGFFWQKFYEQKTMEQPLAPVDQPKQETPVVETPANNVGKAYAMADLNGDVKKLLAAKLLAVSPVYRELALSAAGEARAAAGEAADNYSFAFDYKGERYVVTSDFTGGEHCCFGWYAFTLDARNILNEVPVSVSLADMGSVYPEGEENLVEKSGNLYLKAADDRFMYFCGSYQDSPLVNRYFQILNGKLVVKNEDFKDEFVKAAEDDEQALKNYYNASKTAAGDTDLPSIRCRYFTERAANYMLAGEGGKAWGDFNALWSKLTPLNPYRAADSRYATAEEIKTDIINKFNGN